MFRMSEHEPNQEARILQMMRTVLIQVIKDTTTDPRLKHPLTENTRLGIRDCLDLITIRQSEMAREAGIEMNDRPHFTDEPRRQVKVELKPVKKSGSSDPS